KIVSGPEISTKEPHFSVHILLKKHLAIARREAAMNSDRRGACERGHLPCPLTAGFEASNYAMKNNQIANIGRVPVAVSIYVRKPFLLELTNQVFIERNLEFRWQLDLVRLDHDDLDGRGLDLCRPRFLGQKRKCD